MVSCEKILQAAKDRNADIIGLSGLITPSLDEMASNAAEMKRQGFDIPLLIGGATTSKAHTAIKLAHHYDQPVVQVADASLVVNVCNELTNPEKKKGFVESLSKKQEELREKHATANGPTLLSLEVARSRKLSTDWSSERIETPEENRLGVSVFEEVSLETVVEYFDWSPFFWSWELKGKFPDIFQKGDLGKEAQSLYDDGRRILDQIISEKRFQCRASIGLWHANSIGDDVELYDGKSGGNTLGTFRFLRRQQEILSKKTQYCLADYIAPKSSGITDYIGGFAVTAGSGVETFAKTFEDAGDDYSSIIVKALGDRFAEAMAEYMHHKIRCWWGFGDNEDLDNEDRISEKYQGIRPASGYPCQPDHTEKDTLWKILDAEKSTGVQLTESRAMNPGSSVCGLYFSNPKANYFNLGRINQDQVKDYAARKGWTVAEAEKWLRPNLAT